MAQKSIQSEDLYGILAVTSNSRATDRRDRLFGILGLVRGEQNEGLLLQPNYSLSTQHVFIGLFAHLIINLKKTHLFLHARKLSAGASSPSWIPQWASDESWQSLFSVSMDDRTEVAKSQGKSLYEYASVHLFETLTDCKKPRYYSETHWLDDNLRFRPWNRDIVVHSDTGALAIYLTHLCTIPSQPARKSKSVFEIGGASAGILLTSRDPLDSIIVPGRDHIFMLLLGSGSKLYFILRAVDGYAGARNYELVGTCEEMSIGLYEEPRSRITNLCSSLTETRRLLDLSITHTELRTDVGDLLMCASEKGWNMFPAYHSLLGQAADPTSSFEKVFLSCINPIWEPKIAKGFFQWELGRVVTDFYPDSRRYPREVAGPFSFICLQEFEKLNWNMKWIPVYDPATKENSLKTTPLGKNRTVRLRLPIYKIEQAIRLYFAPVARIGRLLKKNSIEVEAILRGDQSSYDYCAIGCPDFPEMEEDFGLDGSTYQVHIY